VSTGALERMIRRTGGRPPVVERCELCSEPLPEEHRHLLDVGSGALACACRSCSILFERDGAALGRYRLVPGRRVPLEVEVSPRALGVPVGLAFFVKRDDGAVDGHYPSPAGATRYAIDAAGWADLETRSPALRELRPGVEALLLDTTPDRNRRWLVPIDDCYRLVALVRRHWSGVFGGAAVWAEIDAFFGELERRAPRKEG
jgi:uncharacterized protein DUF5947